MQWKVVTPSNESGVSLCVQLKAHGEAIEWDMPDEWIYGVSCVLAIPKGSHYCAPRTASWLATGP